jgi:hypothetical protein
MNRDWSLSEFIPEQHLAALYSDGEPLPERVIGAKILRFGAAPRIACVEGGGLVIDYLPNGETVPIRVVFSFTELGMGVKLMGCLDA